MAHARKRGIVANVDRRRETDLRVDGADFDDLMVLATNADFAGDGSLMAGATGVPPNRSRSKMAARAERTSRATARSPGRSSPEQAYSAHRGPRTSASVGGITARASASAKSSRSEDGDVFCRIWGPSTSEFRAGEYPILAKCVLKTDVR